MTPLKEWKGDPAIKLIRFVSYCYWEALYSSPYLFVNTSMGAWLQELSGLYCNIGCRTPASTVETNRRWYFQQNFHYTFPVIVLGDGQNWKASIGMQWLGSLRCHEKDEAIHNFVASKACTNGTCLRKRPEMRTNYYKVFSNGKINYGNLHQQWYDLEDNHYDQ